MFALEPQVFRDPRGFFFESHNDRRFNDETGQDVRFVQDNHSRSSRGVLRGLHYQVEQPQGKLIRVIRGAIYDVAVGRAPLVTDVRSVGGGRPHRGQKNRRSGFRPGFSHGFVVLSENAEFLYKATDYWHPEHERTLLWNDPVLRIDWPLTGPPTLAAKDAAGRLLADADVYD